VSKFSDSTPGRADDDDDDDDDEPRLLDAPTPPTVTRTSTRRDRVQGNL